MYVLNKIVWLFLNPVTLPLTIAAVGAVLLGKCRGRTNRLLGGACAALALAALWFETTLTCACLLGLPLERPYLSAQTPERLPSADAIVVLGGGICKRKSLAYPDLQVGADRVWHAARLWKAGKAPLIVLSGVAEEEASQPLLLDLGVPKSSILIEGASRNTYENSRLVEKTLGEGKRILLVTSAWHMNRARGNFARTSLAVTPAPCDFAANNAYHSATRFWEWIAPSADSAALSSCFFKEWLGRFARR